jgi:hypothetical protein
MPRAEYDTSLASSFCKRPAFVRAYIVDGVEEPINVKHRNGLLVDLYNLDLTRRYIVYTGHTYKTIHERLIFGER